MNDKNELQHLKMELLKLIKIKSIITIVMVIAFIIGWFKNKVSSEQFVPLVATILTFYFAKNDKT